MKVEIVETLTRIVDVNATSREDALRYVRAVYKAGEVVLTADNANVETQFREFDEDAPAQKTATVRAVYKEREDGEYDFVAAFAVDQLPGSDDEGAHPCSDWPAEIAKWFEDDGESVLVVNGLDLSRLTDIYTP